MPFNRDFEAMRSVRSEAYIAHSGNRLIPGMRYVSESGLNPNLGSVKTTSLSHYLGATEVTVWFTDGLLAEPSPVANPMMPTP